MNKAAEETRHTRVGGWMEHIENENHRVGVSPTYSSLSLV